MKRQVAFVVLLGLSMAGPVSSRMAQAENLKNISLYSGLGTCYTPVETFPFKLSKSDPLYEEARKDHQRYLEEMEDYVNCLDQERSSALQELRASFDLFLKNFGKDAVLEYGTERGVDLTE